MAEGGSGTQLGGLEYEFIFEVPDKWICPICYLPLKDPVQVVGCGHRFCEMCMNEVMKTRFPKCPADRKAIIGSDGFFKDVGCNREMQDLGIKCSNTPCSWTGKLRTIDLHLMTCEKALTNCVNNCGAKDILRDEMEKHLTESCPNGMIKCEFNSMGCQEMISRKNMDKHMESNSRSHLLLACKKISKLEDAIKLQRDSIDDLFTCMEEAEADIQQLRGTPITQNTQTGIDASQ